MLFISLGPKNSVKFVPHQTQSEKLFTSLEKMLVEEAIDHYVSKTSSSLPLLQFEDKQRQEHQQGSAKL